MVLILFVLFSKLIYFFKKNSFKDSVFVQYSGCFCLCFLYYSYVFPPYSFFPPIFLLSFFLTFSFLILFLLVVTYIWVRCLVYILVLLLLFCQYIHNGWHSMIVIHIIRLPRRRLHPRTEQQYSRSTIPGESKYLM